MKAIYAGSFDPFHRGHEAVLRTSLRLFSKVRVVIGSHPTKVSWFSDRARLGLIQAWVKENKSITRGKISFDTLPPGKSVIHYAICNGYDFLVRGIRGVDDVSSEMTLSEVNQDIARVKMGDDTFEGPETIWIPKPINISSSIIREVMQLDDAAWIEVTKKYIPESIYDMFFELATESLIED